MGRSQGWYRKQKSKNLYVQPMDMNEGGGECRRVGDAGQRGDKGRKIGKIVIA